MKALVVFSGGMDSSVALAKAVQTFGSKEVQAVSFKYGSKHNDQESLRAARLCEHYGVKRTLIELPLGDYFKSDLLKSGGEIPEGHYADPSMKKTVVPFRNGIMLSIAAGFAESIGADLLVLGNHAGDHAIYPDCREEFITPMKEAIAAGTYAHIKLWSPFVTLTKTQIAKLGSELGVPFAETYSCYKGQDKHCGKCGTCFERREAFKDAGVTDPTEYEG